MGGVVKNDCGQSGDFFFISYIKAVVCVYIHANMSLPTMKSPIKRPRGRPPLGACLNDHGQYELPPEAIEAAAERVVRHRGACRARYTATRAALRLAKPDIFKQRRHAGNTKLDDDSGTTRDTVQGP